MWEGKPDMNHPNRGDASSAALASAGDGSGLTSWTQFEAFETSRDAQANLTLQAERL